MSETVRQLAHESQIPKRGDFVTTYMGQDNVVVARHSDGGIRVFVNSCVHRGNRICFADRGMFPVKRISSLQIQGPRSNQIPGLR